MANTLQGVGEKTAGRVACPGSVVVEVGNQFDHHVGTYLSAKDLLVEVISDRGEISVDPS